MEAYLTATKSSITPSARAASAKPSARSARPLTSSLNSTTSLSTTMTGTAGMAQGQPRRERSTSVNPAKGKKRLYDSLTDAPKPSSSSTSLNIVQGGLREANKAIVNTLGKDDNPITNSTAYQRSLHVSVRLPVSFSCSPAARVRTTRVRMHGASGNRWYRD